MKIKSRRSLYAWLPPIAFAPVTISITLDTQEELRALLDALCWGFHRRGRLLDDKEKEAITPAIAELRRYA